MDVRSDKETQRWRDEFIVRLRMQNASGAQIADALKTVESHCAETGESPHEAFGDSRTYADSLRLGRPTPLSTYLLAIPAFLGATFLAGGIPALIRGTEVPFTWADGVSWVLLLAGVAVLIPVLERNRRPMLGAWLVIVAVLVASMALGIIGRDAEPWLSANPWLVTVGGVLMLAVTVAVVMAEIRENAIADPLTGEDMIARESRWTVPVAIGFPLALLAITVVVSLIGS